MAYIGTSGNLETALKAAQENSDHTEDEVVVLRCPTGYAWTLADKVPDYTPWGDIISRHYNGKTKLFTSHL